jgi:hypothetical protein
LEEHNLKLLMIQRQSNQSDHILQHSTMKRAKGLTK